MGFVAKTGQSKAFTGTVPTGIPDHNSIQAAVAGTLSSPSSATKNLDTLASLAHLDMFLPKRSSQPIDCLTFRGFPQPTFNVSYASGTVFPSGGGYAGNITINLNSNSRFVGFPYRLVIQVWSGAGFTPPEPDNPGSGQTNYATSTLNISAGTVLNTQQTYNLSSVEFNQASNTATFSVRITYYHAVDGINFGQNTAYYNDGNTEVSVISQNFSYTVAGQIPVDPYPHVHTIYLIDTNTCSANIIGNQTVYSTTTNLATNGVLVSATPNVYTNISNNINYYWFSGGIRYRLVLRTVSGQTSVLSWVSCGAGTPPQQ